MSKFAIKSIFEQISEEVFVMKDLNEAKEFVLNFVQNKQINEKDKAGIIKAVNEAKSLYKLQYYIANALLKYESLGVGQLSKTCKEAAIDELQKNDE